MDPKTSRHSTVDLEVIFLWDTLGELPNETKSCVFFHNVKLCIKNE